MTDSFRDELRIVGGHPALDLVNTVTPRIPGRPDLRDYLRRPTDLLDWSRRIELVDPAEGEAIAAVWEGAPDLAEKALRATDEIREATYAVLAPRAGGASALPAETSQASVYERLMLRWAAAAARSMLVARTDGSGVVDLRVGTAPALMIPDRLVAAAIELLRTVELRHLRACPTDEGGCGWLFLDRSRNGSRRWCSMEDCGTRAKIRKLSERRRATSV
ncbi:CGNR zinc finger domain-containing protein [Kribbella sp. NBC_00889]|uniref:CGNR zinc finger domain-containing protein n=1 Tax=Kribbella sp. NBC_00889 TaxID=2975974 RepID=UPI0038697DA3|nr:CGNR zinc finger domain-containing protein [Kribbella sp. NBC_00889]